MLLMIACRTLPAVPDPGPAELELPPPVEASEAPAEPPWRPQNQCSKADEQILTCLGPEDTRPDGVVVTSLCWTGGGLSLRSGLGGTPDTTIEGEWTYLAEPHRMEHDRVLITGDGSSISVQVDGQELCDNSELLTWMPDFLEGLVPPPESTGLCQPQERVRFSCELEDGRTVSVCDDELRVGDGEAFEETPGPPRWEELSTIRGEGAQLAFEGALVIETLGSEEGNFFGLIDQMDTLPGGVKGSRSTACKAEGVHGRLDELK